MIKLFKTFIILMNRPRLYHIMNLGDKTIKKYIYNAIVYIKYFLYPNLNLGSNISFVGMPTFRNQPGGNIRIGDNCTFLSSSTSNYIGVNRPCILSTQDPKANVVIGNNCGFSGTVIGAFIKIELKDNVRCGANTLITDSDWHLDDPRAGKPSPILIEENVWLGEGVKVLKGVTIGKNSVIGAGSVVTKSIPENVIAAGNPCKVIKTINIVND